MTTVRSTPAPPDSGSDGDRGEVDRHLDGDGQTGEHPDRRDDRMENRGDPEFRVVGARVAPQDDHGDVNQGVGQEPRPADGPIAAVFFVYSTIGFMVANWWGSSSAIGSAGACSFSPSPLHPTHARHTPPCPLFFDRAQRIQGTPVTPTDTAASGVKPTENSRRRRFRRGRLRVVAHITNCGSFRRVRVGQAAGADRTGVTSTCPSRGSDLRSGLYGWVWARIPGERTRGPSDALPTDPVDGR